jgi:hypothetical protein
MFFVEFGNCFWKKTCQFQCFVSIFFKADGSAFIAIGEIKAYEY